MPSEGARSAFKIFHRMGDVTHRNKTTIFPNAQRGIHPNPGNSALGPNEIFTTPAFRNSPGHPAPKAKRPKVARFALLQSRH
jgi:hypothetical protein